MSFCISTSILFNANLDGQSVIQTRAQDLLRSQCIGQFLATVTSSPELPVTVCPKVCVSYSLERGGWPWLLQASWALLGWVQAVGRMRLRLAPLILALRLREQHVGGLFSWWTSGRWRAGGHPGCTSAVSPITHWTKQNKSRGWGGVLPLQRKGRVGGSSCSRSKKTTQHTHGKKEKGSWGSTG